MAKVNIKSEKITGQGFPPDPKSLLSEEFITQARLFMAQLQISVAI